MSRQDVGRLYHLLGRLGCLLNRHDWTIKRFVTKEGCIDPIYVCEFCSRLRFRDTEYPAEEVELS